MIWNGLKHFSLFRSKKYLVIFLLVPILFFAAMYFGWFECWLGKLLLSKNNERPELGMVWEVEHKKRIANDQLSKLINNRSSVQNGSVSFSHILVALTDGKGVMISYAHFIDFYRQLPRSVSKKIFSPYLILKVASENVWDRTYFEKIDNKINICLLDKNNIILEQNDIEQKILDFNSMIRPNFIGCIENLPNFNENIYPANIFFSVLSDFPEDIRNNIISSPEKLISVNGEFLRVGISNIVNSKTVEIGVEIEDSNGYQVIFFQGNLKDVNNMISILNKFNKNSNLIKSSLKPLIKR